MAPPSLLGPPERSYAAIKAAGSFVMPKLGLTESKSATYLSTGHPCLDFFFHVVPDTPADQLLRRLESAWAHDPLTTLKLICSLRGIRGTGKSDKGGFYTAALWLHEHHPKTLALNIRAISEFGYIKDSLEILHRLVGGPDVREIEKVVTGGSRKLKRKRRNLGPSKLDKAVAKAEIAVDRYTQDSNYQFLHDNVSALFADLLKHDLELLNEGKVDKVSLASKWCPSLDSSYDRATLICESIGKKLFSKDDFVEYQDLEEAHYAYRVRTRLRKEVLVPLRKALELPEVFICAKKWDKVKYENVPAKGMKRYQELFYKHDKERFVAYLDKVKKGESSIAAGGLKPHEIVASVRGSSESDVGELQWKRLVDDFAKRGKLKNCMAICDVSERMEGVPLEVSVALGLLVSELSEDPWKGKLITFNADPEFQEIKGDTLSSKSLFVEKLDTDSSTNFQKVFDRILEIAVKGNLKAEDMIQRLFVFSSMEFKKASANKWETDYVVIQRKFKEKGYEKVPEIVFWNLMESPATPVPANQNGVALVSGYSKNLVSLFLEEGGISSPEAVMLKAISGEEYEKLQVFD